MIWNPWERLRRAENALRQQTAALETLSRELVTAEAAYRDLVERTIQMRREGFGPAMPIAPDVPAPKPLPKKVLQAVLAVGEQGLEQYARGLLEAGFQEGEVVDMVLAGGELP